MSTPSSRRREGREAFDINTLPEDICPYKYKSYNTYREDWFDGWYEQLKIDELNNQGIETCSHCGHEL